MPIEAYYRPASATEAAILLEREPGACALAGGTDLLVQQRAGLRAVSCLVDLKQLPGLVGLHWGEDRLRIGAATPAITLTADAKLAQYFPGLREAIELIGSVQIQGRCSVGGNLCNASPAADTTPALLVNDAVAVIQTARGERRVPVAQFVLGPGQTCLGSGEFLVALELPLPPMARADAALRFTPRTEMDIAVANAAVALELDAEGRCVDIAVAIGAVGPRAVLVEEVGAALRGRALDEAALLELVQLARRAARPIDDKRGTADFRRHVVGVLARRAALLAAARSEQRR